MSIPTIPDAPPVQQFDLIPLRSMGDEAVFEAACNDFWPRVKPFAESMIAAGEWIGTVYTAMGEAYQQTADAAQTATEKAGEAAGSAQAANDAAARAEGALATLPAGAIVNTLIAQDKTWSSSKIHSLLTLDARTTLKSDFESDEHFVDDGTRTFAPAEWVWDVERATPTYALTANGKYREVPPNTIAREWSPETQRYQMQSPLGATNLILHSCNQKNLAWNSSGVSRELSSESIIEGQVSTKITQDSSTGNHEVRQAFSSPVANSKYFFFSIIKNDGIQEVRLLFTSGLTGNFPSVTYNYSAQSLTSANADEADIIDLGNGYSLIYFSVTSSTSPSSFTYYIRMRKDGQDSFTGDGTSGIYIAHAQLVQGTTSGPVIVTEDAPVTVDDTLVSRELGVEFNNSNFSVAGEFIVNALTPSGRLISFTDSTPNNRIELITAGGGDRLQLLVTKDGSTVASAVTPTGSLQRGTHFKTAFSATKSEISLSINGGGVYTAAISGGLPIVSQVSISQRYSGEGKIDCSLTNYYEFPYAADPQELTQL